MKNFKIKSYCKINLSLRVIRKLRNGYHNIMSYITFCDLHDIIVISKTKNFKDEIIFSGRFKGGISRKSNTITKVLSLLRKNRFLKNQNFRINIKKNIPHGSGLGGGSSNAAYLLNHLNSKMKLRLNKNNIKKFANKIGFDVPINLEKKNTFLTGKRNEISRFNKKFGFNLLIIYPNLICRTGEIYRKNKKISLLKPKTLFKINNKRKMIDFLKKENNDLEKIVIKTYPKVGKIIKYIKSQKGCYFSRITGSGSACIGIFSNMKNAIYAQKSLRLKYPKYWCIVSKTI